MNKKKYIVVIEKAKNNYSAFSPDVPGCITTGDTLEEIIANMREAIEFHLEALNEPPTPKGLKFHIENGIFDDGEVDDNYFITQLEIELPEMA